MNSPIIAYRANMGVQTTAPFANTYSLEFDGVDDYVHLGDNNSDLQPTSAFSLSVWVKFDALTGIQGIWEASSNVGTFGNDGYIIWKSSSNKFQFYIKQGYSWKIATATTTVTIGTYYHILCTWDGSSTSKIFVNGTEEGTQSVTSINYNANTGINLGGYQAENASSPYLMQGNIDEASIFHSEISVGDVWDGSGTPTDLSLLATPPINWLRMGENGSYKSPQWLIPNNENKDKVSNYSFDFDGVDDYISTGYFYDATATPNLTISFWFKSTSTSVFKFPISLKTNGGLYTNCIVMMYGDNLLIGDRTGWVHGTNQDINDGNWHNVIVTAAYSGNTTNGTLLNMYLDGNLTPDLTSPNMGSGTNSYLDGELFIGNFNGTGNFYDCTVNDVAVWESILNSSDITATYNGGTPTTLPSGAVAHYKVGEEATFSTNWTVPDQVGSNDGTSANMTIEDRIGEAPNSTDNALSSNMDLVDRTTDVPT